MPSLELPPLLVAPLPIVPFNPLNDNLFRADALVAHANEQRWEKVRAELFTGNWARFG